MASPLRIAAIVVNHRTPDATRLAVGALFHSTRKPDDIIVVDNDCVESGLNDTLGRLGYVTVLQTGRNLGFSGGVNAGVRLALERSAGAAFLVNSDVTLRSGCLGTLERALLDSSAIGVVGPTVADRDGRTIVSRGIEYRFGTGRMRLLDAGLLLDERGELPGSDAPIATTADAVSGCAMLIRREVFDAIGLFDETYFFSFEEIDFCLRARRAGFGTRVVPEAVACHEGGRSIGPDSPRRLYFAARNHLLLGSRWPASSAAAQAGRAASIVALNLAHAVTARGGSLPARLIAVARGTRDHFSGRYGPD